MTALGFGSAPLGNLYTAISDDTAEAAVDAAWAAGIRFFDTAPQYGFGLASSGWVARWAKRPRGDFVLSTKVGRILEDCDPKDVPQINFVDTPSRTFRYDYSYDGVLRSFEASLRRLGVDFIDILLVHDVDAFTHGSREASDQRVRELFDSGGYRALDELKRAGRVGSIGAGVNEWEVCQTLLDLGDFDGFLLAGRCTLLEQTPLDSFLPRCAARDVGIIAGGPLQLGHPGHRPCSGRDVQLRSRAGADPRTGPGLAGGLRAAWRAAGRGRPCNSSQPTLASHACWPEPTRAPRLRPTRRCWRAPFHTRSGPISSARGCCIPMRPSLTGPHSPTKGLTPMAAVLKKRASSSQAAPRAIGYTTAARLLAEGARVVLWDMDRGQARCRDGQRLASGRMRCRST